MRTTLALALALCFGAAPAAGVQAGPSPEVATALSVGSVFLAVGLVPVATQFDVPAGAIIGGAAAAAMVVGPSAGFFYAGETRRGMKSTLLRIGCVATMLAGMTLAWDDNSGVGGVLLLGGGAVALGSVIHDLFTVDDAARARRDGPRSGAEPAPRPPPHPTPPAW